MPTRIYADCLDCGHRSPYSPTATACPRCGSVWRQARYDLSALRETILTRWPTRPFDLWRYRELLPLRSHNPDLALGEGGTPLIRAVNLGLMLGCPHIYIKDERQGPTASFKDRQAAVTIAALKEAGVTEAVIASTGNVAIAYSAYAARAGIKLWAFITSLVPPVKMHEVALYGTQVVKVTGNYDQTKLVAAEFARQRAFYLDRGAGSIPTLESMKTIAFELAEQLADLLGPSPDYSLRAPDWYVQAVSGGLGPLGVLKGFEELHAAGVVERIPALANIQAEGCAPMVAAWRENKDVADPVHTPRTQIATLATGDPGRTYTHLRQRMLDHSRGTFESVSDQEASRAMHLLAKMEGISLEPAAAVAFAGLIKLVRQGVIQPTDVVVVNATGHTIPVEQSVLGDHWAEDVALPAASPEVGIPEDGLLAALNSVADNRFPRVAIVDDHPDARRLIRRILQAQGNYTFLEAEDGASAIELVRQEQPNLLILDLMMPGVDGFSVLDALKADPKTANIPVVVVTAKELTALEKQHLSGQIEVLLQKGDFISDELLQEVQSFLK